MGTILSKYMIFELVSNAGKTEIWNVRARRTGDLLGQIKWFGRWHQYCFYPERDTVFNRGCLEEITFRVEQLQKRWRDER